MNMQQPFSTQDAFAAECYVAVTRAEATAGTRRTLRFYGPDGREQIVDVVVPSGSVTGTRVYACSNDIASMGRQVVAIITVLPHQRWETRGDDLILHLQADRTSALREGAIQVAIGGGQTITVPLAGNQSHARYVYAGYGMPRSYNTQRNGDLIVELDLVDLPDPNAPPTANLGERRWWHSIFHRHDERNR